MTMLLHASEPFEVGRLPVVREPAHLWSAASWARLGLPAIHVPLTPPQRWAVVLLYADPDLARWRDRARWHAALAQLDPAFDRAMARRLLRQVQSLRDHGALVSLDQVQACRHRLRCDPLQRQAQLQASIDRLRQGA